jgi:salicylate biosynthesis isochorismate synthase/menaquinone-specific isochorismate synthase
LWTSGNELYSTAFAASEEKGQALLDRTAELDRAVGFQENERPEAQLEDGAMARGDWHRLMQSALGSIESGSLTKIVAARALNVVTTHPWNLHAVLNWLRRQAETSTTFLIRGSDASAFLGATPELLCRVRGRLLETEALAGSAPRTQGPGLLTSEKENREHQAVIDGISLALEPFCEKWIVAQSPSLLDVPHLFHLRTAIQAELCNGCRISQILQALHPTAAVGGVPRDRALRFLAEHENLERGWYAGAIGWWGEESCELMVALRSAVIRSNRARLFVGSGIVTGSTEESEWNETEAKSLTMLDALGGGNARARA